jgi:flagellar biosynthesis/type III secretory pathway M-ring protein FliF/YscJ
VGSHTVDKRFFKKVPKIEEDRERVVKGELPQEGAAAGRSEKETYTRSENLVDEVIKELNDPAGSIEKITIAVRIPQEPGMTLEQAKSLIAKTAAIPLDDALLAVHFTPVKSPEAIPSPTTPSLSEQLSANGGTVGVIVLAALGLILLVWVLRRAMPKGTVEEIEALTAQLAPGPELEAPQAVVAEADSVLRMKEGIQDIIGRNPAGAAAGLKQWMSESR